MDEDGARFDSGFDDNGPFRVTPEAGGVSLESALRDYGPAAIDDLIPRLRAIARDLDAAHAAGHVHGALHPSKVIVHDDATSLIAGSVAVRAVRRARNRGRQRHAGVGSVRLRRACLRMAVRPADRPCRRSPGRSAQHAGRRSRDAVESLYARARAEPARSVRVVHGVLQRHRQRGGARIALRLETRGRVPRSGQAARLARDGAMLAQDTPFDSQRGGAFIAEDRHRCRFMPRTARNRRLRSGTVRTPCTDA